MAALEALLIIGIANGAPILLERLIASRWNQPVDLGHIFMDGRPLLGRSKTWRGVAAGIAAAVLSSVVLGFPPRTGLWLGVGAMIGDLLSSFLKRRINVPPSGMALGLDQVPEVLIPLLLVNDELGLEAGEIIAVTALFFILELMISRVLFRMKIRKQPY